MNPLFDQQKQLLATRLQVLQRLQGGLEWSLERLPALNATTITEPEVSERISAIVDRFCKLQDQFAGVLGQAHILLGQRRRSFSDVITWAAEQNILADSTTWLELRSLRNRLTHEYDLTSDNLPELMALVRDGFATLQTAIQHFNDLASRHGLM